MQDLRKCTAGAALLAIAVSPMAVVRAQDRGDEVSSLLERAREALGQDSGQVTLQLSGTTKKNGLPARFRWTLAPDGFFLNEVRGPFPESQGFDGKTAWHMEGRSHSYSLAFLARERLLTSAWILSGAWCLPNSPFTLAIEEDSETTEILLNLKLTDGLIRGRLTLDSVSLLPRSFHFDEDFDGGALLLEDWQKEEGVILPRRVTRTPSQGTPQVFDVQAAGAWTRNRPDYGPAALDQRVRSDTSFDDQTPAKLKIRRSERGHFFVRPLIDGKDVGWFLFDSGLGGSILTKRCAESLGLKSFGETFVGGFGGPPEPAVFRQGHRLQLGPLIIDGPVFIEQESLGMADRMLGGEKCAGALGWDVFLRAVVGVDTSAGSVRLFDPEAFESPDANWEELALHWQVPYVRARFAGEHEGWFCIDTGAGNLTALFHHSAVQRLGLLDSSNRESIPAQGARGAFTLQTKELSWFEIAGHRHEPALVELSTAEDGESDPYGLGFVGSGFFNGDRLLFDYTRSRVGFLPRD